MILAGNREEILGVVWLKLEWSYHGFADILVEYTDGVKIGECVIQPCDVLITTSFFKMS